MTISIGSTGDEAGEVDGDVSIAKTWSRSVDEISCRSTGDSGSSLDVEEAVELDGDEERFDELERFRWLYLKKFRDQHVRILKQQQKLSHLFFAASAVRPEK